MANAVFPVPGCPAIKTARPAIFPSCKTDTKVTFVDIWEGNQVI